MELLKGASLKLLKEANMPMFQAVLHRGAQKPALVYSVAANQGIQYYSTARDGRLREPGPDAYIFPTTPVRSPLLSVHCMCSRQLCAAN